MTSRPVWLALITCGGAFHTVSTLTIPLAATVVQSQLRTGHAPSFIISPEMQTCIHTGYEAPGLINDRNQPMTDAVQ